MFYLCFSQGVCLKTITRGCREEIWVIVVKSISNTYFKEYKNTFKPQTNIKQATTLVFQYTSLSAHIILVAFIMTD